MHAQHHELSGLAVVVAAIVIGLIVGQITRLPKAVSLLLAGSLARFYTTPEDQYMLAELAGAFFLFRFGVNFEVSRLKREWRKLVEYGLAQLGITTGTVTVFLALMGWSLPSACTIGILIAFSGSAVVLAFLGQRDEIESPHGTVTAGILIVQDLLVGFTLFVFPLLAGEWTPVTWIRPIAVIASLGLILWLTRSVAPFLIDRTIRTTNDGLFRMVLLLVMLAFAFLAEKLTISLSFGAFLGGLTLAEGLYHRHIDREIEDVVAYAEMFFFAALGLYLDWTFVLTHAGFVLVVALAIMVIKIVTTGLAISEVKRFEVKLLAAISLAQIGEGSFVMASEAKNLHLISEFAFEIFVSAAVMSIAMTPLSRWIGHRIARKLILRRGEVEGTGKQLSDHVVIIGYGDLGRQMARAVIDNFGVSLVIIERRQRDADLATRNFAGNDQVHVLTGGGGNPSALRLAGVERARCVIVTTSLRDAVKNILQQVRILCESVPIYVRGSHDDAEATVLASGPGIDTKLCLYEAHVHYVSFVLDNLGRSR